MTDTALLAVVAAPCMPGANRPSVFFLSSHSHPCVKCWAAPLIAQGPPAPLAAACMARVLSPLAHHPSCPPRPQPVMFALLHSAHERHSRHVQRQPAHKTLKWSAASAAVGDHSADLQGNIRVRPSAGSRQRVAQCITGCDGAQCITGCDGAQCTDCWYMHSPGSANQIAMLQPSGRLVRGGAAGPHARRLCRRRLSRLRRLGCRRKLRLHQQLLDSGKVLCDRRVCPWRACSV